MGRKCTKWICLALFGVIFAGVARAQSPQKPPPVLLKATPIFDGLVRENMPAVVHLEAINRSKDIEGRFGYIHQGFENKNETWQRNFELPENGHKQWSFVYRPNWGKDQAISVFGAGEPMSIPFRVRPHSINDVLIGVVGLDALGVNIIRETHEGGVPSSRPLSSAGETRLVRVGLTPEAHLPDRSEAYRSLNWLLWPDADPSSLTPEQLDAIIAWVADGGHLFLTVSDTHRQIRESRLAEALPVTLGELTDVDNITGFARAVGSTSPAKGVVPVVTMQPKLIPGRSVWTLAKLTEDKAGWVAGTYGLGTVHVVPIGLRNQVVQDNFDLVEMWRRLLWLPPNPAPKTWLGYQKVNPKLSKPQAKNTTRDIAIPPLDMVAALNMNTPKIADLIDYHNSGDAEGLVLGEYLADIPGVAPLPLSWLVIFALTYLFFIGPFDYFLLKALNKQPWTWVTFPVYIILFSAVAMIGTSLAKGSQAVVKRIDIVDVLPGTNWVRGSAHVGIFSTGRTRVMLESGYPRGFAEPALGGGGFMESISSSQTMGGRQLSWGTQTWTLAFAQTQWIEPISDLGIIVSLNPDPKSSKKYEVHIRNGSRMNLSDCNLHSADHIWSMGNIESGSTEKRDWNPARGAYIDPYLTYNSEDPSGWISHAVSGFRHSDRAPLNTERMLTLVCLSDTPLEPIKIHGLSGKEETVTMLRIPFTVDPKLLESQ